jgi:PleD family two-component response regulator
VNFGNPAISILALAITGNTVVEGTALRFKVGMNDFILKPLKLAVLSATLLNWLPKKRRTRRRRGSPR